MDAVGGVMLSERNEHVGFYLDLEPERLGGLLVGIKAVQPEVEFGRGRRFRRGQQGLSVEGQRRRAGVEGHAPGRAAVFDTWFAAVRCTVVSAAHPASVKTTGWPA